jgi:hypothetical protein
MKKYYEALRSIPHTIKRGKVNWCGYILSRDYRLKHFTERRIEGNIEGMERQGRRHKQLLDDLRERKSY